MPHLEALLSRIAVPVLALFGERDTRVDWCRTAARYARTMGATLRADVALRTCSNGAFGLQQILTGGAGERMEIQGRRSRAGVLIQSRVVR